MQKVIVHIDKWTRQQRINPTIVASRKMKGCGARLEWTQNCNEYAQTVREFC